MALPNAVNNNGATCSFSAFGLGSNLGWTEKRDHNKIRTSLCGGIILGRYEGAKRKLDAYETLRQKNNHET